MASSDFNMMKPKIAQKGAIFYIRCWEARKIMQPTCCRHEDGGGNVTSVMERSIYV